MKSLKGKILTGFFIVTTLVLLLGLMNYISFSRMNDNTAEMIDTDLPYLIAAEKLKFNIAERVSVANSYLLLDTKQDRERFDELTQESKRLQEELLSLIDDEETSRLIQQSVDWRMAMINDVFTPFEKGNKEIAVNNLEAKVNPIGDNLIADFDKALDIRKQDILHHGNLVRENGDSSMKMVLFLTIGAWVIGVLIAVFMGRIISNPIVKVANQMKAISEGDLSRENLPTKSNDEIGTLIRSANTMNSRLRTIVEEMSAVSGTVLKQSSGLKLTSQEVSETSDQIAVTMQELAQASDSQASSTNELAEGIHRFSGVIGSASQRGAEVAGVARGVMDLTNQGNSAMAESIEKMNRIDSNVRNAVANVRRLEEHSRGISQLIQVISDIAEQTNLLALNAAIEAARAGEQGKGFAVVAGEVKKLAEQVSSSVADITELVQTIQSVTNTVVLSLEESFSEVEEGTGQIQITGDVLQTITESVADVSEKIQEISDSLEKMTDGAKSMESSVSNIASVSEESAAGIEETAASVEEETASMQEIAANAEVMAGLAEQLNSVVSRFKLQ